MIHWLTDPWQYDFFRRGIVAATMAGALTGLIGIYVVLRRMSYIGHGLSHAILGGTVVGYLANYNFYVIGAIWGAVSALMVTGLARTRKIGADAAIGIVTTASYAVGIALISQGNHFTRNFEAAFFGNILGVTTGEVWVLAAVSVAVAATLFFLYKQLLFVTFDVEVAATYGVRTGVVDVVFAMVLAAAIIATMRILGVTLIAAAIVTPAVVARLSTDSFGRMLALSTLVGAVSGFAGMYVSYHLDIASGATITLTGAAVFAVVYLVALARASEFSLQRARPG
ncbi:MAG TPA: metal ABC transporter permease [Acidimicrobiales bacterium]|jgi:manganese/iron transport system permease protein/iron/zinc/copper transport system permease protein